MKLYEFPSGDTVHKYKKSIVISSIKKALKLQQGITPQVQHDIIHRMNRFGVTEDALWDCYKETYRNLIRAEFTDILDRIRTDDTNLFFLVCTSARPVKLGTFILCRMPSCRK